MNGRVIRKCLFCSNTVFQDVFEYTAPPERETDFGFDASRSYHRKIIVCSICGHYYSTHQMDLNVLYSGNYANATYHNKEGMLQTFERIIQLTPEKSDNTGRCNRIESFLRQRNPERNADSYKILDVGSGLGVFPYAMSKRGYQVTALDPDARAVQHIREHINIPVICGNFFEVTPPESYDVISFNKVLEHVDDPIAMLRRALTFLKKDGVFYIELPDGEMAKNEGAEREEFFIDHLHIFSFISISLLALKANLNTLIAERLREPSSKFTLRAFLIKENCE